MAEIADIERVTPGRTMQQTSIQWGNVVKGVAIVTAIAVVGVIAFQVGAGFLAAGGPIATPINGLLAGTAEFITGTLWPLVGQTASFLGGIVMSGINALMPNVGAAVTASQIPGATAAPAIGGGILAAVAGFFGLKMFGGHLKDAASNLLSTETVKIPPQREVIHQGHSVRDHFPTPEQKRQQEAPVQTPELPAQTVVHSGPSAYSSAAPAPSQAAPAAQQSAWAERVPQASRRDITPRETSHIAQIQEEQVLAANAEAAR